MVRSWKSGSLEPLSNVFRGLSVGVDRGQRMAMVFSSITAYTLRFHVFSQEEEECSTEESEDEEPAPRRRQKKPVKGSAAPAGNPAECKQQ